ncbi:iron complex outermembrane receptor protein [Litorivivens lipolytica]|uniref:Iron complex outermembrane receptor protein n=1 Tax=Litorivivens lipolytica TaxID=1524264 RepID=A0A7W4W3Z5_9GAMM|nr:TonB-dependent receptor [Litorivivens lipolytica]MBB3047035.1 iron complex outermembrane receptor protein [Litorivivens lipolytica]
MKRYATGVALLGSALASSIALAQGGSQAAPIALEEVIVTAQKKAESLQDTPISLTAFGAERLETDGINSLADIGSKVPSLTIEPFPINNTTLRIFIRGIGISDSQVTQDPPVGIYVDGVYVARATGTALDVAELERMEILRGPQGTLYGRNTTGGAVNLITKRPSVDAFEFKQKFVVGNRDLFTSKTSANLPITDRLAAKVAFLTTSQRGWLENTGPQNDPTSPGFIAGDSEDYFGSRDVQGYRFDLRWDATDWMTVDYAYDFSDMTTVNTIYQPVTPPCGGDTSSCNKGQTDQIKNSTSSRTTYSDKREDELASSSPMQDSTTEVEGHSVTIAMDFDTWQLKYIGAYRTLDDEAYADLTGDGDPDFRLDSQAYCGPAAQVAVGGCTPLVVPKISQNQTSHELQFTGDFADGRVEYIVGAYYFEEEAQEDNSPLHHQLSAPIDADPNTRIVNLLSQKYDIENESSALFGQFTWTPAILEDRLHLTFGYRHSEDSRYALKNQEDFVYIENPLLPGGAAEASNPLVATFLGGAGIPNSDDRRFDNVEGDTDFSDDSFTLTAEFDVTDDINIYAKSVEAYKAGGFNTRDPQRDGNQGPASDGTDYGFGFKEGFASEKVQSYEIGVKSELMDRRLRVNGNVFYSEYTDIQLNQILTGTVADTKVSNAGEAEMQGMEMDVTFLATRDILMLFNYAYLDTEVTKATSAATGEDISDTFVFFSAPQHSYTLAVDWTITQGDWGRLNFNISHNFMDERNGGSRSFNVAKDGDKSRGTFLDDYRLTNMRLSATGMPLWGGVFQVAGWVKNVFDEEYHVTAIDNTPQIDRAVIWGEPRTYGLDLIYEY